jgi:uncharacterized membrane protein YphA (DoxX/SURF4 family)
MARSGPFRSGAPGYESGQKARGGLLQVFALVILRISVGVYMFFFGFEKSAWLLDATPVAAQLSSWLVDASPASRWYLERVIPGAPMFARLVPLAAMAGGAGLVLGLWTRIAAALSLVAVLSLQLGSGVMFRYAYLADASGLPLIGALIALIIGGNVERREEKRRRNNE